MAAGAACSARAIPTSDPERSKSRSLGIIVQPALCRRRALSIDYIEIRKNNEITGLDSSVPAAERSDLWVAHRPRPETADRSRGLGRAHYGDR